MSNEERPSLRRLLSQALAALSPSVHQPSHLEVLNLALLAGLSQLLSRLSGYASGLPLLPDSFEFTRLPGAPQFDHIANCLEILDSFLLGRWATVEEQPQLYHDVINGVGQEDLAERAMALCAVCNIILRNKEFEDMIQIGNTLGHTSSLSLLTSSYFSQPLPRVCASRVDQYLSRKSNVVQASAASKIHNFRHFVTYCDLTACTV
jgi:hypothetical protein